MDFSCPCSEAPIQSRLVIKDIATQGVPNLAGEPGSQGSPKFYDTGFKVIA